MNKIFILIFLSFGFLSAQDSTGFNNFFGITYSPFGQAQVRESSGFSLGYSDTPEIGVYKNEFNMFFTSSFGIKFREKTFLIFDLNINKGSFLVDNKNGASVDDNSGTTEEGLTLITPKVGVKRFLLRHQHVAPYIRLAFFKTIAFSSFSKNENTTHFDKGQFLEKMNAPFGIEIGGGTEFYFMEQLSFFLDAKFVYQKSSFTFGKKDYIFTEMLKVVSFGFNMYF